MRNYNLVHIIFAFPIEEHIYKTNMSLKTRIKAHARKMKVISCSNAFMGKYLLKAFSAKKKLVGYRLCIFLFFDIFLAEAKPESRVN